MGIAVPITGYFGGDGRFFDTEDQQHVYNTPISGFLHGVRLKTQAIRVIDEIKTDGIPRSSFLGVKWLKLKGYIKPVEFRQDHWLFGDTIFELTAEGEKFHAKNAAPKGEW